MLQSPRFLYLVENQQGDGSRQLEIDLRDARLRERLIDHPEGQLVDEVAHLGEALQTLARQARQFGRPGAADAIVDDCLQLLAEKGVWTEDSPAAGRRDWIG